MCSNYTTITKFNYSLLINEIYAPPSLSLLYIYYIMIYISQYNILYTKIISITKEAYINNNIVVLYEETICVI